MKGVQWRQRTLVYYGGGSDLVAALPAYVDADFGERKVRKVKFGGGISTDLFHVADVRVTDADMRNFEVCVCFYAKEHGTPKNRRYTVSFSFGVDGDKFKIPLVMISLSDLHRYCESDDVKKRVFDKCNELEIVYKPFI